VSYSWKHPFSRDFHKIPKGLSGMASKIFTGAKPFLKPFFYREKKDACDSLFLCTELLK
jgi:hypothetical protein